MNGALRSGLGKLCNKSSIGVTKVCNKKSCQLMTGFNQSGESPNQKAFCLSPFVGEFLSAFFTYFSTHAYCSYNK